MNAPPSRHFRRKTHPTPRRLDWAFDQDVGSSAGKMILCVICRFGNSKGTCFASIPKIAAVANCQEATVRKWLKDFQARGWLVELDSAGRSTRTFAIAPDGINFDIPEAAEPSSTPGENNTENPKNQDFNLSSRSAGGRQLGAQIPVEFSAWEALEFLKGKRQ